MKLVVEVLYLDLEDLKQSKSDRSRKREERERERERERELLLS